jgi:hypothetical protein
MDRAESQLSRQAKSTKLIGSRRRVGLWLKNAILLGCILQQYNTTTNAGGLPRGFAPTMKDWKDVVSVVR